MPSSPQSLAPVRSLPPRRLLGVMLLLIGSVLALATAVESSQVAALPPGLGSPSSSGELSVQSAAITWTNSSVSDISAGQGSDGHTCAIESGSLFCWGWGGSGRLGDGDTSQTRLQPFAVLSGDEGFTQGQVTAVSAGDFHTCAVSVGKAYCWGFGDRLGRGVATDVSVPAQVALGGASVMAISAMSTHTCAVTTAGGAWCWGRNVEGQLGDGTTTSANVLTPVQVSGLTSGVVDIGVGSSHSCALMATGGVKCWGRGANGRLGRGSQDESLTPVDVAIAGAPITDATQLSVGANHSCIVTTSKVVRCWGVNSAGQLGRGDTDDGWVPNPAVVSSVGGPALADQVAVSAGQQHTCSVSSTGAVRCWGWNSLGQLGNGQKQASAFKVPQEVPAAEPYTNSDVSAVNSGPEHTCVVRSARAYCWGHNHAGRLGNGGNTWNQAVGAVSVYVPPASISPSTQTISGTEGSAITSSTAFTASGFSGTVTYSATLPAGLSFDQGTGVISGTPSASSSAQVTITASDGAATATATVTFNIAAAPPSVDLSVYNGWGNDSRNGTVGSPLDPPLVIRTRGMTGPVTFTVVSQPSQGVFQPTSLPPGLSIVTTSATAAEIVGTPTSAGISTFYIAASDNGTADVHSSSSIIITVTSGSGSNSSGGGAVFVPAPASPDTTPPRSAPEGVGESDLISEERQEQLTSSAGEGKVLVNGELVDASITQASADLRSSEPAQRSPQQVTELQNLAASMLDQLSTALGGRTGSISLRNTPTGAVILGLATDPVTGQPMEIPVENVVFVSGGGLVLMASGIDGRSPARIGLDGSVEIPEGGYVSVVAGGLTPGEGGEVVVMSTPRLIGNFDVGESGDVREQAALPSNLGSGSHTLVVTVGDEAASLGFRVVPNGVRPTLPVTGSSNDLIVVWSLVFLVAGALVLALDRRRHLFTR